jgi:hypothetical protein
VLTERYTAVLAASGREMTVELVAAIGKAAELISISETMRAKLLRGAADVCADDLVRVTRLADASVKRLALPSGSTKPLPPLRERLIAGDAP